MRIISSESLTDAIKEAIGQITYNLDPAVVNIINSTLMQEESEAVRDVLKTIVLNSELASQTQIPLCQDTGTTVIFAEIGNDVLIEGDDIFTAVNNAVLQAQKEYYLRASMVKDPIFDRSNTLDNTPAIVHVIPTNGVRLRLLIAQKGGGAENRSFLKMFTPTTSVIDIQNYIVEEVIKSGARACPPLIIGIGIGGNFERCAFLSKLALFEPLGSANKHPGYAKMEKGILAAINERGVGAQGMGSDLTAMACHIKYEPCHIASLPVAVNIQCHSHRHIEVVL